MNQPSLLSLLNKLSNQKDADLFAANNVGNINDLLEIVSSENKMRYWANYHQLSLAELYNTCLSFIIKHIQNNIHDNYRVLFIDKRKNNLKLNYQRRYRLLMNVFHPDKGGKGAECYGDDYSSCAPLIIRAYKQIREECKKRDQQLLKSVRKNTGLSKKMYVGSLSGNEEKIKIKLTKTKKPKRRLHSHLVMSIVFICFAFFIISYIFIDKSVMTGFSKKSVVIAKDSDRSNNVINNNSNTVKHVDSGHKALNSAHHD